MRIILCSTNSHRLSLNLHPVQSHIDRLALSVAEEKEISIASIPSPNFFA